MKALEDWPLPAKRHVRRQLAPALKWAAAAAVVLAIGFSLGRQTSSARGEVAALKTSVADLAAMVQREHNFNLSNTVAIAATANTETLRLLGDYARLQQEQRATDQEVVKTALRSFDLRLGRPFRSPDRRRKYRSRLRTDPPESGPARLLFNT